ncbi:hypothetical protein EPA93_41160 [Ktedonosporobacter rubrisoli]|uniref:Uncharacterized protein n=1 Tax=Ktedonosporobacter rubrisoli TaxID=2509675 RepID=A0A4V0Z056_KTERU|nr:hypothetical protein [Ktedonosporobacter rubrisoli]QBD82051.1 hypothetical protein EPA93_41160 [Ktedonosporobacter rubrisoli]
MAKLQDLFAQARRAQSSSGIGFLGKNRIESKPHAAALVVEFPTISAGGAEAALKAGADGLLFTWDGKDNTLFETLKREIEAAKASSENLVSGLRITGNLNKLDRDSLSHIKDQGISFVILPFEAPAHLLTLEKKELEKVVTVPLRTEETYPELLRNIMGLNGVTAVSLDFSLNSLGALTIEELLNYRAVREAARFPAFVQAKGELSEADVYNLSLLGIQAVILTASSSSEQTEQHIKALRQLLEKLEQEEKENSPAFLPR